MLFLKFHPHQILRCSFLEFPFLRHPEAVALIEGDGLFIFLQGPQVPGLFPCYSVLQKLGTDAAALQNRLHEELFDLAVGCLDETLDHAVVVDQELVKILPMGRSAVRYLEFSEVKGILPENRVEIQPVAEYLDLCDPVRSSGLARRMFVMS